MSRPTQTNPKLRPYGLADYDPEPETPTGRVITFVWIGAVLPGVVLLLECFR